MEPGLKEKPSLSKFSFLPLSHAPLGNRPRPEGQVASLGIAGAARVSAPRRASRLLEPWPPLQTQTPPGAWQVSKEAGLGKAVVNGRRRSSSAGQGGYQPQLAVCQEGPKALRWPDPDFFFFSPEARPVAAKRGPPIQSFKPSLGQTSHLHGDCTRGPTRLQV